MKKISLKNLNIQEFEQLSREQLKGIQGGELPPAGDKCNCHTTADCITTDPTKPQECMACVDGGGYAGKCDWDGTAGQY